MYAEHDIRIAGEGSEKGLGTLGQSLPVGWFRRRRVRGSGFGDEGLLGARVFWCFGVLWCWFGILVFLCFGVWVFDFWSVVCLVA